MYQDQLVVCKGCGCCCLLKGGGGKAPWGITAQHSLEKPAVAKTEPNTDTGGLKGGPEVRAREP